ncbi:hypothetical protein GCM10027039_41920 [Terrabacter koreensis]
MASAVGTNHARFDRLHTEWMQASSGGSWESEFSRLIEEWRAVEWRSGGKTLLAALGLQFDEVALCRGLAWLLDPEGGHAMGRHPLHALLSSLDLPVADDAAVEIRVEEARADTRADVVVRVGGRTVVLEAKVLASEQPRQADRLYEHWASENLTLVFLTRTGHAPRTADISAGLWKARAWRDMATLLRNVADGAGLNPSAGAREFIETIGAL